MSINIESTSGQKSSYQPKAAASSDSPDTNGVSSSIWDFCIDTSSELSSLLPKELNVYDLAQFEYYKAQKTNADYAQVQTKMLRSNSNIQQKLIEKEAKQNIQTLRQSDLFEKDDSMETPLIDAENTFLSEKEGKNAPQFDDNAHYALKKDANTLLLEQSTNNKLIDDVRDGLNLQIGVLSRNAGLNEASINTTVDNCETIMQSSKGFLDTLRNAVDKMANMT